jgi:hypothetical protein
MKHARITVIRQASGQPDVYAVADVQAERHVLVLADCHSLCDALDLMLRDVWVKVRTDTIIIKVEVSDPADAR